MKLSSPGFLDRQVGRSKRNLAAKESCRWKKGLPTVEQLVCVSCIDNPIPARIDAGLRRQ